MKNMWFVYITKAQDDTLYTGISNNISERIKTHNSGKGSKSIVKSKRPVVIVYKERCINRSEATKREIEIKKLNRSDKLILIENMGP